MSKLIHKCLECGNEFLAFPSAKRKYCSFSCSRKYLSKHHKAPHLSKYNKEHNKDRMTADIREKVRKNKLNKGECKGYTKYYGKHEHRVVAEWMLDRKLLPEEVVHHIDKNKRNNSPSNLMIFKNQKEHAKHHAQLKRMKRGDTNAV